MDMSTYFKDRCLSSFVTNLIYQAVAKLFNHLPALKTVAQLNPIDVDPCLYVSAVFWKRSA
jgi:hypothetical protein